MFVGRNKIKILTKQEQEGMRKVCRLAREVLDIAAREIKPGVTTDHIDKVVHDACMERDVSLRMCEFSDLALMTIKVLSIPTQLLPLPEISVHES